jgi:hypothetical protein
LHAPATSGGAVNFFTGSDTVVGRSTFDTLINKTFNCANNTCTVRLGSDVTGQLPIANGGTGQATQQLGLNALMPTPVRTGDIIVYNATSGGWVNFPGNNSGTQAFVENSVGQGLWQPLTGSGTVTQVVCGTGLSGGTITTSGTCSVNLTTVINSLGSDTALSNTGSYFDGPSVAQGTSGTWFASGTVTVSDTGSAAVINCKLWDGTTVISSAQSRVTGAGVSMSISLSGTLPTPAANIKISCNDATATTGKILFNGSGNSKDSTLTAHRIQ